MASLRTMYKAQAGAAGRTGTEILSAEELVEHLALVTGIELDAVYGCRCSNGDSSLIAVFENVSHEILQDFAYVQLTADNDWCCVIIHGSHD